MSRSQITTACKCNCGFLAARAARPQIGGRETVGVRDGEVGYLGNIGPGAHSQGFEVVLAIQGLGFLGLKNQERGNVLSLRRHALQTQHDKSGNCDKPNHARS